jgi:small GTP-binding protein
VTASLYIFDLPIMAHLLSLSLRRFLASLKRHPIVTVLGHVNHGKTTLLDKLSRRHVADGEYGGITQHIRAFHLHAPFPCTFIDTPGHAAFGNLRDRGAHLTDLVCLVIALDDGVLPTTLEAMRLVHDLQLPCVLALNKCDKFPLALEAASHYSSPRDRRVKEVLRQVASVADCPLLAEPLGGDVQAVSVSASTGEGLDALQAALSAEAEMAEDRLTFDPDAPFEGTILEVPTGPEGLGPVAWLLGRQGTLAVGHIVVSEDGATGRVRTIWEEGRRKVPTTLPSVPYVVSGWRQPPRSGSLVQVVASEADVHHLLSSSSFKDQGRNCGDVEERERLITKRTLEEGRIRRQRAVDIKVGVVRPRHTFDYATPLKQSSSSSLSVLLKCDTWGSYEAVSQLIRQAGLQVLPPVEDPLQPLHVLEEQLLRQTPTLHVVYFSCRFTPEKQSERQHAFHSVYELQRELTNLERKPQVAKVEILRIFADHQGRGRLVGGRVLEGQLRQGLPLAFKDVRLGILSLKKGKSQVPVVKANEQFGMLLEDDQCRVKEGDILEQNP